MRTFRLVVGAWLTALSAVLVGGGTASASAPAALTCSGGPILPGTYASITVTGTCLIPGGSVNDLGNLRVAPGAVLLANFPAFSPLGEGDATLTVGGNAHVEQGAVLTLGCAPSFGCAKTTSDRIIGNFIADQSLGVLVHGNTIEGNVELHGGGGGVTCAPSGFFATLGSPVFSTFEDNVIGGNVSVSGYQSCWFGFIRDSVGGNVILTNNTLADPDAMEVATNTITGSLMCQNNSPAAQVGDSGGLPNTVSRKKLGECASL